MVFFITGKKNNKYMHKNFSNQSERDTALDSPADMGAVLTRQLTETSRDAPARGRKTRRKRVRGPEGMFRGERGLKDSENTGSIQASSQPHGYSFSQSLCVKQL